MIKYNVNGHPKNTPPEVAWISWVHFKNCGKYLPVLFPCQSLFKSEFKRHETGEKIMRFVLLKGFGQDQRGEVFLTTSADARLTGTSGKVYKLVWP